MGNVGVDSHGNPHVYPWIRDVEEIERVIGPHVRLKVTRLAPGTPHYLATIRAEDFSLDWLLITFGGGDYYVRAFDGAQYIQSFKLYLDYTVPPRG